MRKGITEIQKEDLVINSEKVPRITFNIRRDNQHKNLNKREKLHVSALKNDDKIKNI